MGSNWRSSTWGDEISLEYGKSLKGYRESNGAIPVFGSNGAVGWTEKALADGPGVILGRKGAYRGVRYSKDPFFVIDTAYYVKPKTEIDMQWLYYAIIHHKLGELDDGSPIPSTTRSAVYVTDVDIPPIPEQKAIAHILGSLDDKIELNRRMNATLEGMAQALFKSWFVDFDPVLDNALVAGNPIPEELAERAEVRRQALADGTANREAAKQFPSAFQFTEEMGWIPEGWEVKSFDTLANLDTTSVKPFEQPETIWEHYSIPSYDSSGMPSWDKGSEIKSNKYLVKPGAILSSKLNPETERTWWPFMIEKKFSICSTEFMQFIPHKYEEQAFIYSLIRSEPFQANILVRVTGSTGSRQRAQPKQIAEIAVTDCGELLRTEYITVALPFFQSIRNNLIQTQSLTKLRDTLLPKLISGELRIPDAEKLVEAALA
jgi:type I restriction enzyme S subunit